MSVLKQNFFPAKDEARLIMTKSRKHAQVCLHHPCSQAKTTSTLPDRPRWRLGFAEVFLFHPANHRTPSRETARTFHRSSVHSTGNIGGSQPPMRRFIGFGKMGSTVRFAPIAAERRWGQTIPDMRGGETGLQLTLGGHPEGSHKMKVTTWNVNSIRSRLERLLRWLEKTRPDVVCLQELKATDEAFPYEVIQEAGYQAVVLGQKTYNGVAILARDEPTDVERGLGDDEEDSQARLVAADVAGVRIISAYVPNGQTVGSEKYAYKLAWMGRLRRYLEDRHRPTEPMVLCGDFNVALDDLDVANPEKWAGSVLCHPASRDAFEQVRQWGLTDVFRQHHPEGGIYSWWDYRMLAFPKNDGLRIDHILATQPLAKRCTGAEIDRDERKGQKPSDHAPVIAIFDV